MRDDMLEHSYDVLHNTRTDRFVFYETLFTNRILFRYAEQESKAVYSSHKREYGQSEKVEGKEKSVCAVYTYRFPCQTVSLSCGRY